jgi:hypothetical protein
VKQNCPDYSFPSSVAADPFPDGRDASCVYVVAFFVFGHHWLRRFFQASIAKTTNGAVKTGGQAEVTAVKFFNAPLIDSRVKPFV